jgi:hypothetical protein
LKLQKDIHSYEEVFWKLWSSLNATVNHYNTGKKRLEIIDKDILKINPQANSSQSWLLEIENPQL